MRLLVPAALAAIVVSSASFGHAQAQDDKAAAELLFDKARKLVRENKFAEACPVFAESQRLDPGVGTLLHLADCYERDGKTASAWATFREAANAASTAGQQERVKIAGERAAALEKTLSRVRVTFAQGADVPGVEVRRDGRAVSRILYASGLPVDPGKHEITVTAPGKVPWKTTVDVTTPGDLVVAVPPLQDASAPPTAPGSTSAPASATSTPTSSAVERKERDARYRTAGLAIAGTGIVSLGVASFLALSAKSRYGDKDAHCDTSGRCDDEGIRIAEQARSRANTATLFVGLGVVLVGVGGGLYLGAPERRVGLAPVVGPRVAGVAVGGSL